MTVFVSVFLFIPEFFFNFFFLFPSFSHFLSQLALYKLQSETRSGAGGNRAQHVSPPPQPPEPPNPKESEMMAQCICVRDSNGTRALSLNVNDSYVYA